MNQGKVSQVKQETPATPEAAETGGTGIISTGELGAVSSPGPGDTGGFFNMSSGLGPIGHHSWSKSRRTWVPSAVGPHPMLEVRVMVDKESYSMRRLPTPKHTQVRRMEALADSGAQMVVMGHEHAEMLGIKCSEYLPAAMHIHVADSRSKGAAGMAILELSAKSLDGTVHTTWQQAYIMDGAEHLYLSYEALRELGSLSESFPKAEGEPGGESVRG